MYARPDGSAVALLEVAAVHATPGANGGSSSTAGWPLRHVQTCYQDLFLSPEASAVAWVLTR